MSPRKSWSVYILRCRDGSLYTGISTDIESRLKAHRSGRGSKYVLSRAPFKLVYHEKMKGRSVALRREYEIKQLTRPQKIALLKQRSS